MTVADLVFPDAAAASAAATGAADGARSAPGGHDSGKVTGAEFYFAAKIHLGEDLFAVARLLPNGGVSKPIPAPDGVHVLAMIRNEPPAPRTFAAVRARVLDDYRRDAVARLQAQESAFLRERANILLAPDLQ